MIAALALAAAIGIRPGVKPIVMCVFDVVKAKPGVLSTEVYTVGTEKYVVEYRFREKGRAFTGGIGIYDEALNDGKHFSANESPSGQRDNHGSVELDFLGTPTWDQLFKQCHLTPGFDDSIRIGPPPKWRRVQMPEPLS